jgi:hypothetical protein
MTNKQRIIKLEQEKNNNHAANRYAYTCVVDETSTRLLSQVEGFTVQCCTRENGGTGGDPFHFITREDLDAFAARPDVDLTFIRFIDEAKDVEP